MTKIDQLYGQAIGAALNPIVECMDVDGVVRRIDVNDVMSSIVINDLLDRVDLASRGHDSQHRSWSEQRH
jgi:hypothetical protein